MNSTLMDSSTLTDDAESLMADEMVAAGELDLVEEMRLRTWARKNYVRLPERDEDWHPVILEEMSRIDDEAMLA